MPLEAAALLLWFVVDTIRDDKTNWYQMDTESFMNCIVQVGYNCPLYYTPPIKFKAFDTRCNISCNITGKYVEIASCVSIRKLLHAILQKYILILLLQHCMKQFQGVTHQMQQLHAIC